MKRGSRGADVRELQEALARLGYPVKADGTFGRLTERYTRKFQRKQGMRATGRVSRKLAKRIKLVVSRLPAKPQGTTSLNGKDFYYGAAQKANFAFVARTAGEVTVELVNGSGSAVRSLTKTVGAAGEQTTVEWDGTLNGRPAPEGNYAFRLAQGSVARASSVSTEDAFSFHHTIFPVRGPHDFGQEGARFGAGRSGHTHQGQDVFAECGTPIVAAQGGKVIYDGYQGAAGNYVVIRGWASNEDFTYMHMQAPSSLHVGDTVLTGAILGAVGDTGNASGCHLHFEIWSAPGWYAGGKPYDPLAKLQFWNTYS